MPAGTYVPGRVSQARQAVRETNWSSKNGGFADGMLTLPGKIKVLIRKEAQPWTWRD